MIIAMITKQRVILIIDIMRDNVPSIAGITCGDRLEFTSATFRAQYPAIVGNGKTRISARPRVRIARYMLGDICGFIEIVNNRFPVAFAVFVTFNFHFLTPAL